MTLELPPGPFSAFLFDCDGTIVDSMPNHFIAWQTALAEWHCTFDEQTFYAWGGMPVETIIATLNAQQNLKMPVKDLAERKEQLFYEYLTDLKAVPEVLEQIYAHHTRIPFAVVSGSNRQSVVASLTALNLLDRFETLVCAGDYTHGKPHPEPFLLAAQRLNVDPASCLVFEDTQLGIDSATAAGMQSIKILQPHER